MAGYIDSFKDSLRTLIGLSRRDIPVSQPSLMRANLVLPVAHQPVSLPALQLVSPSSAARADKGFDMANILINVEKGVGVAAEDLLKFLNLANKTANSAAPGVVAGFGVLAGALDKVLGDTAAAAANPAQVILALPVDVADLKAVWPAMKTFLATLGVKV